jgi:hypothetical protein
MCVSCGCGKYQDDHGDKRHITMKGLQDAAAAAGIAVDEVAENIDEAVASEEVAKPAKA